MYSLPRDIKQKIIIGYIPLLEIPRLFRIRIFNELFTVKEKEWIYIAISEYKRKNTIRLHKKKMGLAFRYYGMNLTFHLETLKCGYYTFEVSLPFELRYKSYFEYSYSFCENCDNLIFSIKEHMEKCKLNPPRSKYKCKTKWCGYQTNKLYESTKHGYDCSQAMWKCTLCDAKNIPTNKRLRHLSLAPPGGCPKYKERYDENMKAIKRDCWTRQKYRGCYNKYCKLSTRRELFNFETFIKE
jgi:hypothetical protein